MSLSHCCVDVRAKFTSNLPLHFTPVYRPYLVSSTPPFYTFTHLYNLPPQPTAPHHQSTTKQYVHNHNVRLHHLFQNLDAATHAVRRGRGVGSIVQREECEKCEQGGENNVFGEVSRGGEGDAGDGEVTVVLWAKCVRVFESVFRPKTKQSQSIAGS
jgi:hypothetical protein